VRCEVFEKGITFGRQFGSYPLVIGIPGKYERNTFLDVRVVEYGMRSITAIPPVDLGKAGIKELEAIPGNLQEESLQKLNSAGKKQLKS